MRVEIFLGDSFQRKDQRSRSLVNGICVHIPGYKILQEVLGHASTIPQESVNFQNNFGILALGTIIAAGGTRIPNLYPFIYCLIFDKKAYSFIYLP